MSDELSVTRLSGPNQQPPADSSATVAKSDKPAPLFFRAQGDGLPVVPGYEVTREIARGGMGRVLAARDLTLNRPVAIKVLLPRAGRDGARRFVVEAEITAQLQHPNIPPVYALGRLGDGAPFLAMKLIEGRTLAAQLRDRATPADGLPEFVQAFEHVCQAVGFAHAQGIVHRDLKPANVMVGAFGEVQVMDWGLAKGGPREPDSQEPVTEIIGPEAEGTEPESDGDSAKLSNSFPAELSTEATVAGQVLGTPSYMSPEQARGEPVGPRADVFSLGAMLCEVLTGARPFAGRTSTEVIGATAAGALDEPLAALDASGAPPELVGLAKRCLAPVATDRPANGKEVADELARYRAGAEARLRAAESERAAAEVKAVEQRKRRRVQLALLAALALALLGAAGAGWWLDHQAADRRAERERTERERAEADLRQSEKDARAADDNRRALADNLDRCEAALRNDDAPAAVAAFAEVAHREGQPGGESFAARIARCRADLALLERLDAVETFSWTPVNWKVPTLTELMPRWSAALKSAGITPEAPTADTARRVNESLIRDRLLLTLDLWHGTPGAPNITLLLRETDPDPRRDAIRAALHARDAAALSRLTADGLRDQPPRFVTALASLPYGLTPARRRELLTAEWGRAPNSLRALMALGGTYPTESKAGAAERARWFQAAVAVRPRSVSPWHALGVALHDDGQHDAALDTVREALRLDPRNLNALNLKAIVLRTRGDGPAAVAVYQEILHLDPNCAHPEFYNNYGNALATAGDLDAAIGQFRKALQLNPALGAAHANLGSAQLRAGDLDAAVQSLRAATKHDPQQAGAYANLGSALVQKRDARGAVAAYRAALRLNPADANAGSALGNLLWDLNDLDGAIATFRDAIRHTPADPGLRNNLGILLRRTDDLGGAISEYKEALRLDPQFTRAMYNLGMALRAAHDPTGAVKVYRELLAIEPKNSAAHNGLGNALRDLSDLDGAIAAFEEALRLNPNNVPAQKNLADARKQRDRTAPPPREVKRP